MRRFWIQLTVAVLTAVAVAGLATGCGGGDKSPLGAARPLVFTTIEPLRYFAERIGGGLVDVQVLVAPGQSPATYEPTTRQMTELAGADLLFTVGVPMEAQLIPRIQASFEDVTVVAADAGLVRKALGRSADHSPVGAGSGPGYLREHGDLDPHVWLDPEMARGIVRNILEALVGIAPQHEGEFERNQRQLDEELTRLRSEITELLAPVSGTEMVVFHPAYGYFAEAFGLRQVAIEVGGVTPGSKHLADVIEMARDRGVRAIFVQPQFSSATAAAVAAAIGAELVTLDPLDYDYLENMRLIARRIRNALLTG